METLARIMLTIRKPVRVLMNSLMVISVVFVCGNILVGPNYRIAEFTDCVVIFFLGGLFPFFVNSYYDKMLESAANKAGFDLS